MPPSEKGSLNQETPSFPRRRESCLKFRNYRKNKLLFKFNQDSRLRGNDKSGVGS